MFPFPVVQQVPSWIICLAFLRPQLPVVLVHGFPIPVLTCPSGGKLPHHLFPSLSHVTKQRIIPSLILWLPQFFLEDFSKVLPAPLMGPHLGQSHKRGSSELQHSVMGKGMVGNNSSEVYLEKNC